MLSSLDAIHISAVLEDCVDQLAILGHIMPPTLEGKADAAQIVDDELGQILQDQRDLESRYEAVRSYTLLHCTCLNSRHHFLGCLMKHWFWSRIKKSDEFDGNVINETWCNHQSGYCFVIAFSEAETKTNNV